MFRGVTRNLGYRTSGQAWLRRSLEAQEHDLYFLQEVPPSALSASVPGYDQLAGRTALRACFGRTSSLFIRDALGAPHVPEVPHGLDGLFPFASLGAYVSAAVIDLGGVSTWVVSVHTSPSVVAVEKRRPEFTPRSCERVPYWADAFLAELKLFMAEVDRPVLLAGDLNQALAYDKALGHRCGGELLDSMRQLGLVDVTVRDWGGERPTRFERAYHLDRVFASGEMAERIAVDPDELVDDGASDHAAVTFTVSV